MIPFGLREFVKTRVPVISEPNAPADRASPPTASDEVSMIWGAASFLNFNLELGPQPSYRKPPSTAVREPTDELIYRHGSGVLSIHDHDGNLVDEGGLVNSAILYYVRDFEEYSEEVKTVANVTVILPTIKHVSLYFKWPDVPNFGEVITEQHLTPA